MALILAGGGNLAFAVGWIRCARAADLHRPAAFLMLEMLALAVALLFLLRRQARTKTVAARRYLAWLQGVTASVRDEVARGAEEDVETVSIVAAIHGIEALRRAPAFRAAMPVVAVPQAAAASSTFFFFGGGSSCSSSGGSSCGGGGGSSCGGGGGGCGGGGGGCGGGGGGCGG
jgi:hypothetical protein